MQHIKSRVLLTGCVLFFAPHVADAADIFSVPPKQDKGKSVPYPTSSALLAAARSGAIPDILRDPSKVEQRLEISRSVIAILRDEYHVPTQGLLNEPEDPYSEDPYRILSLLRDVTDYELKERRSPSTTDVQIAASFQRTRENLSDFIRNPKKFVDALDSLLRDYANVLKEGVALKQEQEVKRLAMVAERMRQAELAEQRMHEKQREIQEKQRQLKAVADAEAASKRAEDETRAAAVRQAMEAQAEARRKKLEEILASPAYKLWQVSLQIEEGRRMVESGQKILDYDDAVRREAGVVNLTARRAAGEQVVAGKQLIEDSFPIYRQLGGTARTAAQVRAGPDPAREYR